MRPRILRAGPVTTKALRILHYHALVQISLRTLVLCCVLSTLEGGPGSGAQ